MSKARLFRLSLIGALSGTLISVFLIIFAEQTIGHNLTEESLRHFLVETPASWTLYSLPILGVFLAIIVGRNLRKKELYSKFFEALFEHSPLAITTLSLNSEIIRSNPEFEKLFGFNQQESVGKNLDHLITDGKTVGEAIKLTANAKSGKSVFASAQRKRKNGQFVDVDIYGVPVFVEGKKMGVLGLYHDVTERNKAIAALRESEEKYRDIYDNVTDFLYTHDLEGKLLDINPAFGRAVGFSRDQLLGMNVRDLMPKKYRRLFPHYLSRVMKQENSSGLLEVNSRSGKRILVEYKNSLIPGPNGPVGIRGSARDVTARQELEARLKKSLQKLDRLARTDPLTGLLNRRGIYQKLEGELNRARRDDFVLTVALIDLDGLKFINDNYGHSKGDHAIQAFADSLRRSTRNYDGLGRLGGDEFMVVLPKADLDEAEAVCLRMSKDLSQVNTGAIGLMFTFSAGLATFGSDEKEAASIDRVLSRADKALYAAKQMANGNVAHEEEQQPNPGTKSLASVYRR